jgi:hypothetical protein
MKHGTKEFRYEINRCTRALLALGSIFALVFFASACKNYHLDDADAARAGTGSVAVSLSDGAGARLIAPSSPSMSTIARYDISCSRAGYESKTATGLTDTSALTINDLAEGEWTLTVDAYDSSGAKVATGDTTVTIVAGKTATAAVVLSPIFPRTAGGKGTVSIVFECTGFQAQSNKWHIDFTPATGGSPVSYTYESTPIVTVDQVKNTISFSTTLNSGDWDMVFYLETDSGDTFASAADVVKVYDGLTSGTATGGPISISATDFFKADRVRYVSNTTVTGRTGKIPAQACTLAEAIQHLNGCSDLTEADPGVIILTENVVHEPEEPNDWLTIRRPMKIMSLASAASPFSISTSSSINTLIMVDRSEPAYTGSLVLERVIIKPTGTAVLDCGLIQLFGNGDLAKLTLNAGATVKGNALSATAGGVYLRGGKLVMNAGSEISGNCADYGGGVNSSGATDEIVINGGTISGNTAKFFGGGIYTGTESAIVTLAGGAITDNTAFNGADEGLGAGVFLSRSVGGAFYATAPGGWKAVVYGNHGIGPDLVRQAFVVDKTSFQSIFTAPYYLPTWVDSENPLTIDIATLPSVLTLSTDSEIVLSGSNVTYTASTSIPSSFITIANGTLWVNTSVQTTSASQYSLFTVSGGKLVLTEHAQLLGMGDTSITRGGAINVSGGSVEMRGGEIKSCVAGYGGGVYVNTGGKFYLYDGKISSNLAAQFGGGIYVSGLGELYVNNYTHQLASKIAGNTAGTGKGLFVDGGGKVFLSTAAAPTSWTYLSGSAASSNSNFTEIFDVSNNFVYP